jgi:4-aminobutyrate aminotransferase-like enzyme
MRQRQADWATYAGNPLAVAAAHAVLDVIAEEQLCQRANRLGSHLQEVLNGARHLPGDCQIPAEKV